MKIQLDQDYYITNDSRQFILVHIKKDGFNPRTKEKSKGVEVRTYHTNLKQALERYATNVSMQSQTALQLAKQLKSIEQTIHDLNPITISQIKNSK